jgi:hypothetical protein
MSFGRQKERRIRAKRKNVQGRRKRKDKEK